MTVRMYIKRGCPYCQAAREHLGGLGEAVEERDATSSAAHKAELMEYSRGSGVVPTLVHADGEVQVGFPPGRG